MILVKFQTISADNMRPSEIRYDWLVLKQRTPLHIAIYQGLDPARYEVDLCHPLGDQSAAAGQKMEWIRFRRENGCLDVVAHQYYSDEFTGERLIFPVKEKANAR